MCRMMVGLGNVPASVMLNAAITMSRGDRATHEYGGAGRNPGGRVKKHYDGWGVVFRDGDAFRCHRGIMALGEDRAAEVLRDIKTDVMVIHVRNASLESQIGLEFSHPIETCVNGHTIYFLHNGYAPDVYRLLGRNRSHWDTQELFEWIIEGFGGSDWERKVRIRLDQLPASTSSANFILLGGNKLYVCNWFPGESQSREYFTLNHYQSAHMQLISSEPIAEIASIEKWRPLSNPSLQVFSL